jgi:hypothetical protein
MKIKCEKCGEWVVSFKTACEKCGHDFDGGVNCPYYHKELYSRDGIWEWTGESCGAVCSFDYHQCGRMFLEDKLKHKCDTPEFDRNCTRRKHWAARHQSFGNRTKGEQE